MNDIYDGETFDATKYLTGWSNPGYDDKSWKSVKIGNYDNSNLIASEGVTCQKDPGD